MLGGAATGAWRAGDGDAPSAGLPPVFTAAQARRGREVYGASCARCHGAALEGSAAPALAGPAFLRRWQPPDRNAADLFYVLETSMPKLSMGSLPPDDYTAVFAYLLQRNGMPAGARRFDASDSVLRLIRFDRLATTRTPDPLPAPELIEGERPRPLDAGPSRGPWSAARPTAICWRSTPATARCCGHGTSPIRNRARRSR